MLSNLVLLKIPIQKSRYLTLRQSVPEFEVTA